METGQTLDPDHNGKQVKLLPATWRVKCTQSCHGNQTDSWPQTTIASRSGSHLQNRDWSTKLSWKPGRLSTHNPLANNLHCGLEFTVDRETRQTLDLSHFKNKSHFFQQHSHWKRELSRKPGRLLTHIQPTNKSHSFLQHSDWKTVLSSKPGRFLTHIQWTNKSYCKRAHRSHTVKGLSNICYTNKCYIDSTLTFAATVHKQVMRYLLREDCLPAFQSSHFRCISWKPCKKWFKWDMCFVLDTRQKMAQLFPSCRFKSDKI